MNLFEVLEVVHQTTKKLFDIKVALIHALYIMNEHNVGSEEIRQNLKILIKDIDELTTGGKNEQRN